VSDIDIAVVDSLKALDPKRPIREADISRFMSTRPSSYLGGSTWVLFNGALPPSLICA
jgi:hypothetical protein